MYFSKHRNEWRETSPRRYATSDDAQSAIEYLVTRQQWVNDTFKVEEELS
jgi:hypothetical protein